MRHLYKNIAKIYDQIGISDYSIVWGKSILKFFENEHSDEKFEKNLDLCCGTGALCNFFEENGIKSKGVDISKEMLDIANANFPEIEFICCGVGNYEDDGLYDFITCTDDALNHITDIEEFEKVIEKASSWLREGGYFFFDLINYEFIPQHLVKNIDDETKLVFDHFPVEDGILSKTLQYWENGELKWENLHSERLYETDMVISTLNKNGFILERCTQEFYENLHHEKLNFVFKKGQINAFSHYKND